MDIVFNPVLGASGDMILGALLALQDARALDELNAFLADITRGAVKVLSERVERGGLSFHRAKVETDRKAAPPPAVYWRDIRRALEKKAPHHPALEDALEVFRLLAEAEGEAHGVSPDEVHFHEVGALDSLADICGACFLIRRLLDETGGGRCRTMPLGCGEGVVRSAHGLMTNPAPATAVITERAGLPTIHHPVQAELVTPTAAALIAHFARPLPAGYAGTPVRSARTTGTRDYGEFLSYFEMRLVRPSAEAAEPLVELSANVDDMTPEEAASVHTFLISRGALDSWSVMGQGKKGRFCLVLKALCRPAEADAVEDALFRATTTLGVRRSLVHRTALPRRVVEVETPLGRVRVKVREEEPRRWKAEADDIERLAAEKGLSPREVLERISPLVEKRLREEREA